MGMRLTFMKDKLCRHYQFCNSGASSSSSANSDLDFLRCSNGGQQIIFNELFVDTESDDIARNLRSYRDVDVEKILADLQSKFSFFSIFFFFLFPF